MKTSPRFFQIMWDDNQNFNKTARFNFQSVAHQYYVFFHYCGGVTPLISRQVGFLANNCFLPAHKMTKFCIYSKRPPPVSSKCVFNHQGSKFRGVAPQYFVFFIIGGGLPPGKSSSRVFCQYYPLCFV